MERAHYKYIFYIFMQGTYDYSQLSSFENKTAFSYILRVYFRSAWKDKILLDARSKSETY